MKRTLWNWFGYGVLAALVVAGLAYQGLEAMVNIDTRPPRTPQPSGGQPRTVSGNGDLWLIGVSSTIAVITFVTCMGRLCKWW